MGLFFNRNPYGEKTYEVNGYIIGVNSHKIYNVPEIGQNSTFILPEGAGEITIEAAGKMRARNPQCIVFPGSSRVAKGDLRSITSLKKVILQEGVEESRLTLYKNTDLELPKTIKKLGSHNYPIAKNLVIPEGVMEIADGFFSHDVNIESVILPGTLEVLPSQLFNQCKNLKTIVISEGTKGIPNNFNVFRGTNSLSLLEIPSTLNGFFKISYEGRSGSSSRGDAEYSTSKWEEIPLKVKVKRGEKEYQISIMRKPELYVEFGKDFFSLDGVNFDCNTLPPGEYDVVNGVIKSKIATNNQVSNDYAYFESIYNKYIVDDDYIDNNIPLEDASIIKDAMYVEYRRLKKLIPNYNLDLQQNIDRLFNGAINNYNQNKVNIANQNNQGGKSM